MTLEDVEINSELDPVEELQGKLGASPEEDKLMRTVMQNDKQTLDDGKLLADGINRNVGAFTPDMMYASLVNNYQMAKQLYGERILRMLTGYHENSLQRNLKIPEFHHELLSSIRSTIDRLKDEGYLDDEGQIVEKGNMLASVVMYMEELDKLAPHGLAGEIMHKKHAQHGEAVDTKQWKKGARYRDINVRKTVKQTIRRGHKEIAPHDIILDEKQSRGAAHIIFGMDASASMRGKKLEMAKKAGIALAYKAMARRDKVGLVVFGGGVKEHLPPTEDFRTLVNTIGAVRAAQETEFVTFLKKAIELFPREETTKHIILLSDALPTKGKEPKEDTLKAISEARAHGITLSVVGIDLDREGTQLANEMARIGQGRVIHVKDLDAVDRGVLSDYEETVRT